MTFPEAINFFIEWGRRRYANKTLEIYVGHLRRFEAFIGEKPIEELNMFEDVLKYARSLEVKGRSENTVNLAMTSIRQLWKVLKSVEKQLGFELLFSPEAIPIKTVTTSKSHQPIVEEDYIKLTEAILNDASQQPFVRLRDMAIFQLLHDTGVRVSELTNLDITSLDLRRQSAEVVTRKRRDSAKFREVYWTHETHKTLLLYLDRRSDFSDGSALFINLKNFGRLSPRSIQRSLKHYLKEAGIDPTSLSPHSFRHGFGRRAAAKQMYPPYLQQYLGHRNANSSQVYYNVQNNSVRQEYHAKLGDLTLDKLYDRVDARLDKKKKRKLSPQKKY